MFLISLWHAWVMRFASGPLAAALSIFLFLGGCSAAPGPEQPSKSPHLDHGLPQAERPMAPPRDPATPEDVQQPAQTPPTSIGASISIDLRESDPTLMQGVNVDLLGDLDLGGSFEVLLDPGRSLAITFVGSGPPTAKQQLDGSLAVLVNGEFRVGLGQPDGTGVITQVLPAASTASNELTYLVSLEPEAAATAVSLPVGTSAATSAQWQTAEGGSSLQVSPSQWGRFGGLAVLEYGWPGVLLLVTTELEQADSTSMRHQFQCHVLGASSKDFWNLEPWRPDAGLLGFAAARCNPQP